MIVVSSVHFPVNDLMSTVVHIFHNRLMLDNERNQNEYRPHHFDIDHIWKLMIDTFSKVQSLTEHRYVLQLDVQVSEDQ